MTKKIIFKVMERERKHYRDSRITLNETILKLVKTIGFNYVEEQQNGIGYIWSQYTVVQSQSYKDSSLEYWCHKENDPEDYKNRCEDFDKLMKNIDVDDDEIKGPYMRDEHGKKIIGDVRENWTSEEEGRRAFSNLCRLADRDDFLIEIIYE